MLDRESEVVAELVAELNLAPELPVALGRRHAFLTPDMGEMGELHGWQTLSPSETQGW